MLSLLCFTFLNSGCTSYILINEVYTVVLFNFFLRMRNALQNRKYLKKKQKEEN